MTLGKGDYGLTGDMKLDLYHAEIWLQFFFLLEHNDDCDFQKLMNASETKLPEQKEEWFAK